MLKFLILNDQSPQSIAVWVCCQLNFLDSFDKSTMIIVTVSATQLQSSILVL